MASIARAVVGSGMTLSLAACAANSFPLPTQRFVYPDADPAGAARRDTASVFVDANGSFYPNGWLPYAKAVRRAHSLLGAGAPGSPLRALVDRDEARQLADIAAFGRDRKRIFILIHGFNNRPDEAEPAFEQVAAKLDLRPGDGIIRFYWDGLTGSGLGAGKIWFRAVGNSQLAGSRGLRGILDRFEGKTIYLISHSRGASVILSALGNPVYDTNFKADTERLAASWWTPRRRLTEPAPLRDHGNAIHLLMLAPAIGRIDTCDAAQQARIDAGAACRALRALGGQVKSWRYTVNTRDPVLNKFLGLRYEFNPTTLGTDPEVGRALKDERYALMTPYLLDPPMRKHGFPAYIADQTFDRMLADEGIGKWSPASDAAPPR